MKKKRILPRADLVKLLTKHANRIMSDKGYFYRQKEEDVKIILEAFFSKEFTEEIIGSNRENNRVHQA